MKMNKQNLRTRYQILQNNKILVKENEELKRNLNSKYWDSASVLLDYLYHNNIELYNQTHEFIKNPVLFFSKKD